MSRRYIRAIAALTALIPAAVSAQRLTPAQTAAIDSTLGRLFALNLAPGAGVVVVRDTQVVYVNGFGFAERETRRPFTPQTVHYIASTTIGLYRLWRQRFSTSRTCSGSMRHSSATFRRRSLGTTQTPIRSSLRRVDDIPDGIGDCPVTLAPRSIRASSRTIDQLGSALAVAACRRCSTARTDYSNLATTSRRCAMDRVTGDSWKQTLDRLHLHATRHAQHECDGSRFPRIALRCRTAWRRPFRAHPLRQGRRQHVLCRGTGYDLDDLARRLEANLERHGRIDGQQAFPPPPCERCIWFARRWSRLRETCRCSETLSDGRRHIRQRDTIFTHGGELSGIRDADLVIHASALARCRGLANSDLGGVFVDLLPRPADLRRARWGPTVHR